MGDYHDRDLRGQSFVGAALDGADSSGADVRAADFNGASLVNTDFTHARIGVKPSPELGSSWRRC